jgi:hypothetical protein
LWHGLWWIALNEAGIPRSQHIVGNWLSDDDDDDDDNNKFLVGYRFNHCIQTSTIQPHIQWAVGESSCKVALMLPVCTLANKFNVICFDLVQ